MAEAKYMFCIHCEQRFITNDYELCSLCGKEGGLIEPDDPKAEALMAASESGAQDEDEDEDEDDDEDATEYRTVPHSDGTFAKAEALISVFYILAWLSAFAAVMFVLFTFGRTSSAPNTGFGAVIAAVIPGVLQGIIAFAVLLALAEGLRLIIAIERNTRPPQPPGAEDAEDEDDEDQMDDDEDDEGEEDQMDDDEDDEGEEEDDEEEDDEEDVDEDEEDDEEGVDEDEEDDEEDEEAPKAEEEKTK